MAPARTATRNVDVASSWCVARLLRGLLLQSPHRPVPVNARPAPHGEEGGERLLHGHGRLVGVPAAGHGRLRCCLICRLTPLTGCNKHKNGYPGPQEPRARPVGRHGRVEVASRCCQEGLGSRNSVYTFVKETFIVMI
jgi:hypothetical protein